MLKWCMADQKARPVGPRDIYVQRVNAVMDFVEANLADDLQLERLAEVAQFSPYHFHRIFSATTGETLGNFIKRVRLEHSIVLLSRHPGWPVTQVAHECGFSSSSSFARSFGERYGTPPSKWRTLSEPHPLTPRKVSPGPNCSISAVGERWEICFDGGKTSSVRVVQLASCEVGYVRHVGPFAADPQVFSELFGQLYTWASPMGYVSDSARVLAVYHDSPKLTAEAKLRVSACIEVPANAKPSGTVGRMSITGGRYAVGSFVLGANDYEAAWNAIWGAWLPASGYQPADGLVFERFVNPAETANCMDVEICIPVQAM